MKTCGTCGAVKPDAQFGRRSTSPDGLRGRCRSCRSVHEPKKSSGKRRAEIQRQLREPGTKKCSTCKQIKAYAEFSKCRNRGDGLQVRCKTCHSRIRRESYRDDSAREITLAKAWRAKNRGRVNGFLAAYRTKKARATPTFANQAEIQRRYDWAALLAEELGTPFHVDHIVPLQSPIVCGLHVHANLRVLPKRDNLAKSNRFWPDMP